MWLLTSKWDGMAYVVYISHRKLIRQFLPCSGRGGTQKLGGCSDENTCVSRASWKWYLSKLELPHAVELVRLVSSVGVVVRCQYSLWTQLNNPYD